MLEGTIKMLHEVFETSTQKTEQCKIFYRLFRKEFGKLLENVACEIEFRTGHFEIYGFFKLRTTQRYWYFSLGDLRTDKDTMLVRTAKDNKDYTGGCNRFVRTATSELFIKDLQDILQISL